MYTYPGDIKLTKPNNYFAYTIILRLVTGNFNSIQCLLLCGLRPLQVQIT